MSHNSSTTSSGIGLMGILFVVFLVLKLTGNIDWSWWWVTAPLWAPSVVSLIVIAFVFAIHFVQIARSKS